MSESDTPVTPHDAEAAPAKTINRETLRARREELRDAKLAWKEERRKQAESDIKRLRDEALAKIAPLQEQIDSLKKDANMRASAIIHECQVDGIETWPLIASLTATKKDTGGLQAAIELIRKHL